MRELAFLMTAALIVGTTAVSHAASWVRVTEHAAFSIRDTAEDVVFEGKMWLSNGYYYDNVLTRDLWCSTDGAEWTLNSKETPYDGYSDAPAAMTLTP